MKFFDKLYFEILRILINKAENKNKSLDFNSGDEFFEILTKQIVNYIALISIVFFVLSAFFYTHFIWVALFFSFSGFYIHHKSSFFYLNKHYTDIFKVYGLLKNQINKEKFLLYSTDVLFGRKIIKYYRLGDESMNKENKKYLFASSDIREYEGFCRFLKRQGIIFDNEYISYLTNVEKLNEIRKQKKEIIMDEKLLLSELYASNKADLFINIQKEVDETFTIKNT